MDVQKKKRLEEYLNNIPQLKEKNYHNFKGLDYPTIWLIIKSIADIMKTIINTVFSVIYIIYYQYTKYEF